MTQVRTCIRCRTIIEPRKRRCQACGGRPSKPFPRHKLALKQPREAFVEANGGYDGCWICRYLGVSMAGALQRDHWHSGPNAGDPRGILCIYHNRKLGAAYTEELVDAMHAYQRKNLAERHH